MRCRKALDHDFEHIYMMGYDEWADGLEVEEYLKSCFQSQKYKKGNWWVVEDNDEVVSSLIVYTLPDSNYGIGPLATTLNHRNKGYASYLLNYVTNFLRKGSSGIFLYSDIATSFYERRGFKEMPKEFQRYEKSKYMYFGEQKIDFNQGGHLVRHDYF